MESSLVAAGPRGPAVKVEIVTDNEVMHGNTQRNREATHRALAGPGPWDDIMYGLYVKQKIEAGLRAVEEGRTISHEEMKRRLLAKKRHAWPDHLPATRRATANSHRAARQPQSRRGMIRSHGRNGRQVKPGLFENGHCKVRTDLIRRQEYEFGLQTAHLRPA